MCTNVNRANQYHYNIIILLVKQTNQWSLRCNLILIFKSRTLFIRKSIFNVITPNVEHIMLWPILLSHWLMQEQFYINAKQSIDVHAMNIQFETGNYGTRIIPWLGLGFFFFQNLQDIAFKEQNVIWSYTSSKTYVLFGLLFLHFLDFFWI